MLWEHEAVSSNLTSGKLSRISSVVEREKHQADSQPMFLDVRTGTSFDYMHQTAKCVAQSTRDVA